MMGRDIQDLSREGGGYFSEELHQLFVPLYGFLFLIMGAQGVLFSILMYYITVSI